MRYIVKAFCSFYRPAKEVEVNRRPDRRVPANRKRSRYWLGVVLIDRRKARGINPQAMEESMPIVPRNTFDGSLGPSSES